MPKNTVVEPFTASQVTRYTGLNYRTLDHWARTGFIVPSIATADGSGSDRLYSFTDVVALRVARDLRAQGIRTGALTRIVERLRESEGIDQPLVRARFIVAGGDVLKVGATRQELISLMKKPNQTAFAFFFDLEKATSALRAAIKTEEPVRKRAPRIKRTVSKAS
jgi:DNA-binding transcriptional MerR regulator